MSAEIRDVLTINVVLAGIDLLNTQELLESFSRSIDSEVISEGLALVAGTPSGRGRLLTLKKDRIALSLSSERSAVTREYPTRDGLDRLAEIAGKAIEHTDNSNQTVSAYGFNIELAYDQDSGQSASAYLADRLFGNFLRNDGWDLTGGSAMLRFSNGPGKLWIATIEPRFRDVLTERVFLILNLHREEDRFPTTEEIRVSLEETWDEAQTLVQLLDRMPDTK